MFPSCGYMASLIGYVMAVGYNISRTTHARKRTRIYIHAYIYPVLI